MLNRFYVQALAGLLWLASIPLAGQGQDTVRIGNQTWTTRNLDVEKFRNGDPIPQARTNAEWKKAMEAQKPAWCYYNNDPVNGLRYGKLYNWYAVIDPRGLAPKGWHIPSTVEWYNLMEAMGGEDYAGRKLKTPQYWMQLDTYNEDLKRRRTPTNESGFSALPGGIRDAEGFKYITEWAFFWSTTEADENKSFFWYFIWNANYFKRDAFLKGFGYSVRCVRN